MVILCLSFCFIYSINITTVVPCLSVLTDNCCQCILESWSWLIHLVVVLCDTMDINVFLIINTYLGEICRWMYISHSTQQAESKLYSKFLLAATLAGRMKVLSCFSFFWKHWYSQEELWNRALLCRLLLYSILISDMFLPQDTSPALLLLQIWKKLQIL